MRDGRDLERDLAEEDEVRALLSRGDRDLIAPAFDPAALRPPTKRPAVVLALVALLLVVAAVGGGVGAWRVSLNASPSPSAGLSGPPTASAADAYALLIGVSETHMRVITERDLSLGAAFDARPNVLAISPNGREIAFWRGDEARELWLISARNPQGARLLLTLNQERGAGVVWAPDGQSLMVGVTQATPGASPYTALRVLQRDGSAVRELALLSTDQLVQPLAWDASRGVGAAVEALRQKGPGRYIVVTTAVPSASPSIQYAELPDARDSGVLIGQLRASSDARLVMATWNYRGRDLIRIWPLESLDPVRVTELTPATPGETIRGAAWRPGTMEIGVNVAGTFQIWMLDGRRRPVRDFNASAVAFTFRYDGSALYSTAAGSGRLEITDLTTPALTRREIAFPGGIIVGSVSVDPAP